MAEKVWHLKSCELFANLPAEQIRRLESHCRVRSFAVRSLVYLPYQAADSVFLLTRGLVKVCHATPEGKQSTLAFIEPGELFGELALFDPSQRDEFVEVVNAASVVMIPAEELLHLMAQANAFAVGITKLVGLRRQRIQRRLRNLLFQSNRDRLIHLLLDLADQFGVPADSGVRLRIKLSHQELANLIGSTRESVTIVLGQLKSEGLIDVTRRRIAILRPHQMAERVGQTYRAPSPPGIPTL
ncbi:Global nitrogen regulator [Rosistilla carotiformis]|uniref:Global nitrogen regulator n=1 Tax=Rosistilla carotiformis TaxID=2528017 RepID=A0A518JX91_9BACT|nr:Crp/Fnr family transcriptional regulator [Rosistilla carotiformis]QDV70155.1 Global nitrogen regulator [Rosistilla carotiformis]